jgi:hypothetical protein
VKCEKLEVVEGLNMRALTFYNRILKNESSAVLMCAKFLLWLLE